MLDLNSETFRENVFDTHPVGGGGGGVVILIYYIFFFLSFFVFLLWPPQKNHHSTTTISYTRSIIVAIPCPTPIHMVASP